MNRIDPSLLSPQMRQKLAMMLSQGMGQRPAPAADPTISDSAIPGEIRAPQPQRLTASAMPGADRGVMKEPQGGGWASVLGTIGATLQDTGVALNGGQGNALDNLQYTRDMQKRELEALREQRIGDKGMGSLMSGLAGGGDVRSMLSDPRAAAAIMRDPGRASALMEMFQEQAPKFTSIAEGAQLFNESTGEVVASNERDIPFNDPRSPSYQQWLADQQSIRAAGRNPVQPVDNSPDFGDVSNLRKEFTGITADYRGIVNNINNINTMGNRSDAAGDLALVVGFTKLLDPGSVAREGEVALTQSVAGLAQQASNWLPRLEQGNTLLPAETRAQLVAAANDLYKQYERAFANRQQEYTGIASRYGIDPQDVIVGGAGTVINFDDLP